MVAADRRRLTGTTDENFGNDEEETEFDAVDLLEGVGTEDPVQRYQRNRNSSTS